MAKLILYSSSDNSTRFLLNFKLDDDTPNNQQIIVEHDGGRAVLIPRNDKTLLSSAAWLALQAAVGDGGKLGYADMANKGTDAAMSHLATLRRNLARIEVDSGAGVFGVKSVASQSEILAEILLDLPNLGPDYASGASAVLTCRIDAAIALDVDLPNVMVSPSAKARLRIEATIQENTPEIKFPPAMAGVSIGLPDLPSIDLALPKVALPNLNLGELRWTGNDMSGLIGPLTLPFPRIAGLAAEADWPDGLPTAEASLVNGDFRLTTTPKTLKVALKAGGTTLPMIEVKAFSLSFDVGKLKLSSDGVSVAPIDEKLDQPFEFDHPEVLPLVVRGRLGGVNVTFSSPTVSVKLNVARLEIAARDDPEAKLSLRFNIVTTATADSHKTKIEAPELIEPNRLVLVSKAASALDGEFPALDGLIRFGLGVKFDPDEEKMARVFDRIGRLLAAVARGAVAYSGRVRDALADLGASVLALLEQSGKALRDALKTPGDVLAIELRVDAKTWAPRQLLVAPNAKQAAGETVLEGLGLKLTLPKKMRPTLIWDFERSWQGLMIMPTGDNDTAKLETDLWLESPTSAAGVVRTHDKDENNKLKPLLCITARSNDAKPPLLLIALQHGRLRAFQTFGTEAFVQPAQGDAITGVGPSGPLEDAKFGEHVEVSLDWSGIKQRALALLPSPKEGGSGGGGALDEIAKRVEVTVESDPIINEAAGEAEIGMKLKVTVADGFEPVADLNLTLDLRSFKANLKGDRVAVMATGQVPASEPPFKAYGLNLRFARKNTGTAPYEMLVLDFANGDFAVGLGEKARLSAFYDRFAANGEGLRFDVDRFRLGRGGLDLSATAVPDPVVLSGINQPFRFTSGAITIESGQLRGGRISGKGQLPPALVGEAEASIDIALVARNGDLRVESANAVLSGGKKPLYSTGTKFRITVEELGLSFIEADGYHFYFTLSGSAEFRPESGAFAEGLLKNLKSVVIKLERAPLAGDARELQKHIQFQVEIAPPVTANLFDLFKFELRGVGFHPTYNGFLPDTPPAMSISGQVAFLDVGDVISADFDFHQMWIAPPGGESPLPRLRFDGLGVAIDVNGLGRVEGTAVSVDRNTPGLYAPDLSNDVTAEGFLAKGRMDLKGMGRFAASMGWLELRREGFDPRLSMYLYGQAEKLSEPIDTPVGRFNVREVGLGVGIGFTLASLADVDRASSPREAVARLDAVSRIQGDLTNFKAWAPQYERRNVTLALRGLITYASVSTSSQYNEAKEKDLPNPLLFDVVVALRSDLTFLMNVRAWTSYNYNDWISETAAAWKTQPLMRGYMYFSVPRREFLARLVSDGQRSIGKHPQLPDPLIKAMQATRWSSSLYIRPGLFHTEYGWPYELGFALGKPSDNFFLQCSGGLIFRIEDATMLYGVAMRADGRAQFEAKAGGGSFGASVSAVARFAVASRFIAYIAPLDPSDTLFYGMIVIDVAINFRVSVWLSFKTFFGRINLRTSFSLGLALAVAAEIVIYPSEDLGGLVRASVGVRAFGRSMMLRLDFSFGSSRALEKARARVERFMALGLATPVPPDTGRIIAPTPTTEPSRAMRAQSSDQRIATQPPRVPVAPLEPPKRDSPQDQDDEMPVPPQVGRPIGKTRFWAMLFLVRDGSAKREQRHYVMQLLPRDFSDEDPNQLIDIEDSAFFAEPRTNVNQNGDVGRDAVADYRIAFDARFQQADLDGLHHVDGEEGVANQVKFEQGNFFETFMDAGHPIVGSEEGEEKVTLNALLAEMFLSGWKDGNEVRGGYGEPLPIKPKRGDAAPTDSRQAAERMARAGDSRVRFAREGGAAGQVMHESLVAEERRSAFIGGLGASAIEMAERGPDKDDNWSGGTAKEGDIPAHKLGLTFIVDEVTVDNLFEKVPRSDNGPPPERKAHFTVAKRVKRAPDSDPEFGEEGEVFLFRHPSESFESLQPRLAPPRARAGVDEEGGDRRIRMTEKGVTLAWDLEPAWGASGEGGANGKIIADPEADLRTYAIYRVFEGLQRPFAATFNVLPCSTLEYTNTDTDKVLVAKSIPLDRKLVDDFSQGGVPDDLRALLLGLPLPKGRTAEKIWSRYADPGAKEFSITYTVIPRDYMGFAADPEILELTLPAPVVRADAPVQVELALDYPGLPRTPWDKETKVIPELALTLTKEAYDALDALVKAPNADAGHATLTSAPVPVFRLRIRRAELLGGGQFGADAVDEARARPGQADIDRWRDGSDVDLWFYISDQPTSENSADGFPVEISVPDVGEGKKPKIDTLRFRIVEAETELKPKPEKGPDPTQDETKAKQLLLSHMGAAPNADQSTFHARRVFAQIQPLRSSPVGLELKPSLWQPADLVLGLRPKKKETGIIALQVERIEHPFALDFHPLGFEDLHAEGGVLEGLHPTADADLKPATNGQFDLTFERLRDVQRRHAIRLSFNVAGDTLATPAAALKGPAAAPLVGGFDLFEIDPDVADVVAASTEEVLALARRRGSVKALPRSLDGLEPSGVTDFQKLAVHYPTETARRNLDRRPPADKSRPRARWFSRAEGWPVFPKPQLRRSLFPAPDEALIATLLAGGRVNRIEVSIRRDASDGSSATSLPVRVAKAEADAVAKVWALSRSDDKLIADISVTPSADGNLSPAALRQLLRALVWRAESAEAEREASELNAYSTWRMQETTEAGAKQFEWVVSVTSKWDDIPRASETETISLHSSLAAPLAEAIDQLRYASYGDDSDLVGGTVYRRYEPVIDSLQPPEAKTLDALIEGSPAKRDPYGWGFLRAAGLAAGLRLFDTETGDYVRGRELASLVAASMNWAVRRYVEERADEGGAAPPLSALGLGQPMVELLSREDALFLVGSDDGQDKTEADSGFFDSAAATMAQIALRPVPQAFAVEDPRELPVRYLLLRRATFATSDRNEPTITPVDDQGFRLDPDGSRFVWDIADLTAPGVGQVSKRMIAQDAAEKIGLSGGSTAEDVLKLGADRITALMDETPVLLVRLTLLGAKKKEDDRLELLEMWDRAKDNLLEQLKGWVKAEWIDTPVATDIVDPTTDPFDPFERFEPLEGEILTALTRVSHLRLEGNGNVLYYPLHQREGSRGLPVNELRRLFPKDANLAEAFEELELTGKLDAAPTDKRDGILAAAASLSNRLSLWTERFLVQGSAQRPTLRENGTGGLKLPFGLAAITDPDGLARSPDLGGAITLLLVERDRYGSRRRFMIRPWGRYASLAAEVDGIPRVPTLSGALPPRARLEDHCVEVVLNRSEPIEAPTILYAGPPLGVADEPPGEKDLPAVDFVVARSLDHVIADANISAQRALQPQFHGVAFRRRYADLERVKRLPELQDFDGLEPFGPDAAVPAGEVIETEILDVKVLEALAESAPDSWRGADLYRLRALPHCFEVFGMAHVSAGVVVSDVSVAALPRPRTTLRLPTMAAGRDFDSRPLAEPPKFSFRRGEANANEVWMRFTLPLVRNADCMTEASLLAWLGTGAGKLPQAFRLPDAQTSYRISFDARDRSSTGPEIEIVPRAVNQKDTSDDKLFAVAATGPNLADPLTDGGPKADKNSIHWYLQMEARANVVNVVPGPEQVEPKFTAEAGAVGGALNELRLVKNAPYLDAWLAVAPRCKLTFAASETNNLDGLRTAIANAWTALELLDDDDLSAPLRKWLADAKASSVDADLWRAFFAATPTMEGLVPPGVLVKDPIVSGNPMPQDAVGFVTNLQPIWQWTHNGDLTDALLRPAAIRRCLLSGVVGKESKRIAEILIADPNETVGKFLAQLRQIWLYRNRGQIFANRRPGAARISASIAKRTLPPAGLVGKPPPEGFGITVGRVFEFNKAEGTAPREALDDLLAKLEVVEGAPLGLADSVHALHWMEVLDTKALASVAQFSAPLPWHLTGLLDTVDGLIAKPPQTPDDAVTLLVAIPPEEAKWEALADWLKNNGGDATAGPMTAWGEAAVALLFGAAGVPYLRAYRPGSPPVSTPILPASTRPMEDVQP